MVDFYIYTTFDIYSTLLRGRFIYTIHVPNIYFGMLAYKEKLPCGASTWYPGYLTILGHFSSVGWCEIFVWNYVMRWQRLYLR